MFSDFSIAILKKVTNYWKSERPSKNGNTYKRADNSYKRARKNISYEMKTEHNAHRRKRHSKHRNSVLSNGLVIEGDKLNPGLIETYAEENGYYPDATYQDMLEYYMAVSKAQQATGLPLVLYWNYEYSANINRLNDQKKINQLNYWGDRSTATEFSVSLSHFGKALCMLTEVKALNDAWDEAHPNAYN